MHELRGLDFAAGDEKQTSNACVWGDAYMQRIMCVGLYFCCITGIARNLEDLHVSVIEVPFGEVLWKLD